MVLPKYPFPVVGGLERQAHELSKVLLEKGVDVQVLSSKFNPDDAKFEIVEDIPVYRIPLSKLKWFRFLQSPIYLLWTLFKRRNTYDVIHLHQFGWFCLFGIISAKLLSKPTITKLPNVAERGIPGLQSSKVGRIMLSILLSSDAIVAMSRESVSELEAVDFPLSRALLTPNGIRNNHKIIKDNSLQFLHEPRIVFVGRLMQQKGIEDLLYAWQMLMHKSVGAKLEIWGEGPIRQDMESLSMMLGISDSVQFFGHVDDVINKLPNMDIFVLPSYIEGNSNAILEAMLAGLPIVATRVGGTAMQVGKAGAEFLFEPKDRVSLSLILEKLINNPALRESMGNKMKARVKEYFDIQCVADTYISAYTSLHLRLRDKVIDSSNLVIMEG
jgi:glycosyltransferase involved in cell wall biosynthesis